MSSLTSRPPPPPPPELPGASPASFHSGHPRLQVEDIWEMALCVSDNICNSHHMKKIIETLASYFAISIQKNFPLYCTTGYCAIIFTYCCDIVTCSCPLSFSFMVYAVRMLFFGLALLIAARPDLDNPGCYRDGWDYFRGICEGISIIFFLFKLGDEIQEIFRHVAGSSIA